MFVSPTPAPCRVIALLTARLVHVQLPAGTIRMSPVEEEAKALCMSVCEQDGAFTVLAYAKGEKYANARTTEMNVVIPPVILDKTRFCNSSSSRHLSNHSHD